MPVVIPYATHRQSPARESQPALQVSDLAIAPAPGVPPVLHSVNLTVSSGCHVALVGANGTGKTTLLRTLAGVISPAAGQVLLNGTPAACGNPHVAYLAQRHLIEWNFPVTVRQAVLAGRYPHLGWLRRPGKTDRAKADHALAQLGLTPLADRPLDALSGGQQQRVLLARALCQEAAILLLDEPLTGLDQASRAILDDFFARDSARHLTLIMATHDRADAEKRFDLILEIRDQQLHTVHSCTCRHPSRAPA